MDDPIRALIAVFSCLAAIHAANEMLQVWTRRRVRRWAVMNGMEDSEI